MVPAAAMGDFSLRLVGRHQAGGHASGGGRLDRYPIFQRIVITWVSALIFLAAVKQDDGDSRALHSVRQYGSRVRKRAARGRGRRAIP